MRLDKYLKVSGLVKRRTVAKQLCDAGRIRVNGNPAKAGTRVKQDDEVDLFLGRRRLKIRVQNIEAAPTSRAEGLFTVLLDEVTEGD